MFKTHANINYTFNRDELTTLLEYGQVLAHDVGDVLLEEGTPHQDLMITLSGETHIFVATPDGQRRVGWMEAGQFTGDIAAITVMYKIDGFNAEANDWYWVQWNNDGLLEHYLPRLRYCGTRGVHESGRLVMDAEVLRPTIDLGFPIVVAAILPWSGEVVVFTDQGDGLHSADHPIPLR